MVERAEQPAPAFMRRRRAAQSVGVPTSATKIASSSARLSIVVVSVWDESGCAHGQRRRIAPVI
jgi:hypothetical protein